MSWNDKKPDRKKDLKDLNQILKHYWEFVEDEAYETHLDLFDVANFTTETAAAHILGRHLRNTLSKSEMLKKTITKILEEQTSEEGKTGLMLRTFAIERGQAISEIRPILQAVLHEILV